MDSNAWALADLHRDTWEETKSGLTPEEIARAGRIARRFHQAYEELAPRLGYETRPESAVPWESVPDANKRLMVATVRQLISEGTI